MTRRPAGEGRPLLRSGPFLRFWAGHATSALGDRVSGLALPYIAVTMLRASPLQVAVLTAALWAPNLLAVLVGTWVDEFRRRRLLMVLADLVRSIAIASVPVAALVGGLTFGWLCAAALALGAGGVVHDSASPGFFVRLVRREQFLTANSALSSTTGLADVTGPALGGALIHAATAPVALLVDSASFLVSAVATASVRIDEAAGHRPVPDAFSSRLKAGAAYLLRHRVLRASLLASTTVNAAALAVQALVVLYAVRFLDLDAGRIGAAVGLGAVGGLVGALTAAPVSRVLGTGRAITLGISLNTLPFAALPLADGTGADPFTVLAAAECVSAWSIMLFDVNNNALRAAVTRDDVRSRVSGAYSTLNYGIRPLGALAGGAAAALVGPGAAIAAAAVLGALAGLWIVASPVFRRRTIVEEGTSAGRAPRRGNDPRPG